MTSKAKRVAHSDPGRGEPMARESLIPIERIASQIYLIRGEKVMLDSDLAALYGIETGALTRAMKRNRERFPDDFCFQLSKEEFEILRSQTGISSQWGGRRYPPWAFTEHGVAMLSAPPEPPKKNPIGF